MHSSNGMKESNIGDIHDDIDSSLRHIQLDTSKNENSFYIHSSNNNRSIIPSKSSGSNNSIKMESKSIDHSSQNIINHLSDSTYLGHSLPETDFNNVQITNSGQRGVFNEFESFIMILSCLVILFSNDSTCFSFAKIPVISSKMIRLRDSSIFKVIIFTNFISSLLRSSFTIDCNQIFLSQKVLCTHQMV